MGEDLGTIQIGNEPDLLGDVRPAYSEAANLADVAAYRASIAAVAPDVHVSGPDTAAAARLASYGHGDGAGLAFLTQHFYPLTRCAGSRPTIDQLLSISGLLVIHALEGGRWLPCTGTPPGRTWEAAVKMPDGVVRVVIVNPSPSAATDISLHSPGYGGRARVQWLTGPSLGATADVRLGGAEVGSDGAWRPLADAPLHPGGNGVQVKVPAATAALVTLAATPSGP